MSEKEAPQEEISEITENELLEYMTLQKELKQLSEKIELIREKCKKKGSFCTENMVCSVVEKSRVFIAPLHEVSAAFGIITLDAMGLVRTSKFETVQVSFKKGSGEDDIIEEDSQPWTTLP